MLNFLAPALLWGAGLILLPIAAHFMHRRVRRKILFPALQFLQEISSQQTRFANFRRWVLMVLRCLALLFIVAAFARLMWEKASPLGEDSDSSIGVVFLIDLSPSMDQRVQGQRIIDVLKGGAERVLDGLSAGRDRVNLVTAGDQVRVVYKQWTHNLDLVREDLRTMEVSSCRTSLNGALTLAGNELEQHSGRRRLVILTDRQASHWEEVLSNPRALEALPEMTRVDVLDAGLGETGNLTLSSPRTEPPFPIGDQPVQLVVDVTHHSDEAKTVHVAFELDGKMIGERSVQLGERETRQVGMNLGTLDEGYYSFVCRSGTDALAADNEVFGVVRVRDGLPILILTDEDAKRGASAYFIERALSPRNSKVDRYRVSVAKGSGIEGVDLSEFAAVVLSDVSVLSANGAGRLKEYVEAGGGVLAFCGEAPMIQTMSVWNGAWGEKTPTLPMVPTMYESFPNDGMRVKIVPTAYHSKFFRAFDVEDRELLGRIRIRSGMLGADNGQGSRKLMEFSNGATAMSWSGVGTGQVVVANFSPALDHTTLGKYGAFVALMQSLVRGIQPKVDKTLDLTTGDSFMMTLPAKGTIQQISVRSNEGSEIPASPTREDTSIVVTVPPLLNAGHYHVQVDGEAARTFAVNLDAREGDLRRVDAERLGQHLARDGVGARTQVTEAADAVDDGRFELWPYLLLGVLVFIGLESLLLLVWRQ